MYDAARVLIQVVRKNPEKSYARMDVLQRAQCWALRNPPPGGSRWHRSSILCTGAVTSMRVLRPYAKIPDKVRKKDGTKPSIRAVQVAVRSFTKNKKVVGRQCSCRVLRVALCTRAAIV